MRISGHFRKSEFVARVGIGSAQSRSPNVGMAVFLFIGVRIWGERGRGCGLCGACRVSAVARDEGGTRRAPLEDARS